jgi:Uma2 family endonuclease
MPATQHLTTADELLRLPKEVHCELVRGELREMSPAGSHHGRLAGNIFGFLFVHVQHHRLGVAYAAETGFRLSSNPDTVLAADVAFVTRERYEAFGDTSGYFAGPPDMAAEVMSPSDSLPAAEEKVAQWMEAGTRMLLLVNPRKRTVTVYRSATDKTLLTEADVIDGADVIPGWKLPVSKIFE